MKKILVFGIFDGIHPGHISFLRQAKGYGDFLIVAAGRASACKKIKCKTPRLSLKHRINDLTAVHYVDRAVPGDIEQGSYLVILREKPDIICLGYDQKELANNLKKWLKSNNVGITVKILKSYKPDKYHNSLLGGDR